MLPNLDFDPEKLRPTLLALGGEHLVNSRGEETFFWPARLECAPGWGLEEVRWYLENEWGGVVAVRCESTQGNDSIHIWHNPVRGNREIYVSLDGQSIVSFSWEKKDFFARGEEEFAVESEFVGNKKHASREPATQKRYSRVNPATGLKKMNSAFSREHRESFERAKGVLLSVAGAFDPNAAPWCLEPKWLETLNLVIKEIDALDRKPTPRLPRGPQPEQSVASHAPHR